MFKTLSSSALRLTARGRYSINVNSLSTSVSSIRYGPEAPQNKLDEIFPLVDDFPSHHIGPRRIEAKAMLQELGYNVNMTEIFFKKNCQMKLLFHGIIFYLINLRESTNFFLLLQNLDELTDAAVPENIRLNRQLDLEKPYSKFKLLNI